MYRGGKGEKVTSWNEEEGNERRRRLEERSLPNGIRALVATVKDFPTWTRSNLRGPHFGD